MNLSSLLKKQFLLACFTIGLTSCTVGPLGLEASTKPLTREDGTARSYKNIGKADGTAGYFSLFGIIPFGSYDMKEAIENTQAAGNGDALINVRYWTRNSFFVIGTYSSIEVKGDVIKFVDTAVKGK